MKKKNKISCPLLVLWGNKSDTGKVWGDVLKTWGDYSISKPIGEGLDCGHYLQEEKPKEVIDWLKKFFIMSDLSKKKCVACDGNIPPFDKSEIHKYLKKVDDWEVKKGEKENFYLIKEFKFKNFEESQKFVNKVGEIAETENHHPDIHFGWGYCKVKIFTHAIKGLAESDFILAAKIDKIS